MSHPFNLALRFAEVCSRCADQLAIKYLDQQVTYRELDALSDSLAGYLLGRGLGPGDVVSIVNTKEPHSLALMVACLKIGVASTNMDRDIPPQRADAMLKQCRPRYLFFDDAVRPELASVAGELGIEILRLQDLELPCPDRAAIARAGERVTGSRIAYIMFTSGSTGVPKGVVITHQNVLGFLGWSIERFQITEKDVFTNVSHFYFDNSVFDFFTALFSGACIAPIRKHYLSRPAELLDAIDRLGCTIWFSVPSLLIYLRAMKALDSTRFRTIRTMIFGGEGFPKSELHKLYTLYRDRITFVNVYGPTEGTCICSSYTITDADFRTLEGLPPLGTMNPNFDYLILDEAGKPADRGELCILGPNVGVGYYRDPEKSKASFSEHYDNGFYGDRMYRTGDLVAEQDELLYFLGRSDNQIKHMGYRIELEEIELALSCQEPIKQAAVIYQRVSEAYGQIVAFVSTDSPLENARIKLELRKSLPDYMIPSVILQYPDLPRNANGKIDRSQLRSLSQEAQGGAGSSQPQ
jgi:D-alanine--poly(phosphoribitol) ligase subunit 1